MVIFCTSQILGLGQVWLFSGSRSGIQDRDPCLGIQERLIPEGAGGEFHRMWHFSGWIHGVCPSSLHSFKSPYDSPKLLISNLFPINIQWNQEISEVGKAPSAQKGLSSPDVWEQLGGIQAGRALGMLIFPSSEHPRLLGQCPSCWLRLSEREFCCWRNPSSTWVWRFAVIPDISCHYPLFSLKINIRNHQKLQVPGSLELCRAGDSQMCPGIPYPGNSSLCASHLKHLGVFKHFGALEAFPAVQDQNRGILKVGKDSTPRWWNPTFPWQCWEFLVLKFLSWEVEVILGTELLNPGFGVICVSWSLNYSFELLSCKAALGWRLGSNFWKCRA